MQHKQIIMSLGKFQEAFNEELCKALDAYGNEATLSNLPSNMQDQMKTEYEILFQESCSSCYKNKFDPNMKIQNLFKKLDKKGVHSLQVLKSLMTAEEFKEFDEEFDKKVQVQCAIL